MHDGWMKRVLGADTVGTADVHDSWMKRVLGLIL